MLLSSSSSWSALDNLFSTLIKTTWGFFPLAGAPTKQTSTVDVVVAQQSVLPPVAPVYINDTSYALIDEPEPEALTDAEMAPFKALEALEEKEISEKEALTLYILNAAAAIAKRDMILQEKARKELAVVTVIAVPEDQQVQDLGYDEDDFTPLTADELAPFALLDEAEAKAAHEARIQPHLRGLSTSRSLALASRTTYVPIPGRHQIRPLYRHASSLQLPLQPIPEDDPTPPPMTRENEWHVRPGQFFAIKERKETDVFVGIERGEVRKKTREERWEVLEGLMRVKRRREKRERRERRREREERVYEKRCRQDRRMYGSYE